MTDHDADRLTKVRAGHAHNAMVQQTRALRTVEDHAIDPEDRAMLVAMLGLDRDQAQDARSPHTRPLP